MDFTGRSLRGHGIDVSRLYGESIPDTKFLCDVKFTYASLERSQWQDTVWLKNCSFRGANLKDAVMDCVVENCDFTDATIDGASIYLTAEQLCSTASYRYKNLKGFRSSAPLSGVSFAGFDLRDTMLYIDETCDLTDADIRGATLVILPLKYRDRVATGMYPKDSVTDFLPRMIESTKSYKEGTLEGCSLGVNWSGLDFSRLNLTNARFGIIEKSRQTRPWAVSQFHDSVITGADCRNLTLEQIKQTWNYKNGRMKGIIVSKVVKSVLDAEKAAEKPETNETPEESQAESVTASVDTTEINAAETSDTADPQDTEP